MLLGFVSDENYAALAGVQVEVRAGGRTAVARSTPSGRVEANVRPGPAEVILSLPGFGSKRVRPILRPGRPIQFRLLSDRLLGYSWPKWCRGGDDVRFRVHAVEPYKLGLWRYGHDKEFVRNVGWYDNHGPRACMQILPDGFFAETGVAWNSGYGQHGQKIQAPERTGLYYFHAKTDTGKFFSFPLVVAPARPRAAIAVLASTNTWNAYNPFGGRSNYILAARMIEEPIVNSWSDLPRYKLSDYGEWKSPGPFDPLSFDRPEPINFVPEDERCIDPIEGRSACHVAPAEWRLLAWLEREEFDYDLYSDAQLHDGTLPLDSYRVLILNTHPEYWTEAMYRSTKKWVFERGGRLLYLGGNGINCEVEFLADGTAMTCRNAWPTGYESRFHHSAESEASLLGVAYTDPGAMTVAPYAVERADHWIFAGTGLRNGDLFGTRTLHARYGHGASGHETDKINSFSPPNTIRLAKGLNPDDGGAHLTLHETPSGGIVFSAGSITYPSALLCDHPTSRITRTVLERLLGEGAM